MHRIQWRTSRVSFLVILISTIIFLSAPGAAWADGPVDPESLPGNVNVTDSDPGAGEQWGRAGGRDIEYVVLDPGQFSALSWGIVNGTTPGAAFDNAIDALSENLTFNPGGSDLGGGIAQWIGSAQITLVGLQTGVYVLETRFTLTVTDDIGGPVSLAFASGEVDPGIDVINDTNSTFNANLLFEAKYPVGIPAGSMIAAGDDTWIPLLDLFDDLDTGINQDGFAHTSVNRGFYFTLDTSEPGLTLEQHDETVNGKLDVIQGDTDFLRIEVPGRLVNVDTALGVIDQLIRELPTTAFPPDLATRGDVDDASDRVREGLTELTRTLLIVLGLLPFDGQVPDDILFENLPSSGVAEQDSVDAVSGNVTMVKNTLQALVDEGLANQASVDALQAAIDGISTAGVALQASVDALQAALDGLSTDGLATQASVDALQTAINGLSTDGLATQASVDALQAALDGLSTDGLATQASVDALQAAINGLSTDGLATQASVDLLQVAVDGLIVNVVAAISAANLATQPSVDELAADVASVEAKIDQIQTALANPDPGGLDVSVEEITPRSYRGVREYVLLMTLQGEAVNSNLSGAVVIILENGQAIATDIAAASTATVIGVGMIDVRVPSLIGTEPARAYRFSLQHSNGDTVVSRGSALVVVDWPGEEGPPEHENEDEEAD